MLDCGLPRFASDKLLRALMVRGLSNRQAAIAAGIDRETMRRALSGLGVSRATMVAIYGMLERVSPKMAGDPGDLLAEDESP